MPNTKATGVAFADPLFTTCYASEELGYGADAQGTVTQATNKSTAVTLNKSAGRITMSSTNLTAPVANFTLNNSLISANDVLIVNISGGETLSNINACTVYVNSMTTGSATISVRNLLGADIGTDPLIINFAIIHGAS